MLCFKSKVTLKCENRCDHTTAFQLRKYIAKVMVNEPNNVNCRQPPERLFIQ